MDEMNDVTVVNENEAMPSNEVETQVTPETVEIDAELLIGGGMLGGALIVIGIELLWNSKPVRKLRAATVDKAKRVRENLKKTAEERQRKKLAKVKGEIIDAEVVSEKAVNE